MTEKKGFTSKISLTNTIYSLVELSVPFLSQSAYIANTTTLSQQVKNIYCQYLQEKERKKMINVCTMLYEGEQMRKEELKQTGFTFSHQNTNC